MVYKTENFISSINGDFTKIIGFKKKAFRKKLDLSKMWNDLDATKNDLDALKKYFKNYRSTVEESVSFQDSKNIPISGYYTPETNKIELILITNDYDTHEFTDDTWWEFKFLLVQVFCHELIHMMQFSNRDFFWSERRCKFRKVKSQAVNEDRKYHSTMDEIQAYAHCIFLELMEFGFGVPKLKKDMYKYQLSITYNLLLKVFGNKKSEPTIQKTIYYVNQWAKKYKVA